MICANCGSNSSHIKADAAGNERCHVCGGFTESGGPMIDGILTRSAFRIRSENLKFEGDLLPPHVYNKTRKKLDINPDFLKKYPEQAHQYYDPAEIKQMGYDKLNRAIKTKKQKEVKIKEKIESGDEFHGDAAKGQQKIIKELKSVD